MSAPRDDWKARDEMERKTREGLELAGPMSMAASYYVMLRQAGVPDMEARFRTLTRDRWTPAVPGLWRPDLSKLGAG